MVRRRIVRLLAFAGVCVASVAADAAQRVTLYTSVDEPYVRPLVRQFEKRTGIDVTLVTDTEASKTAGLVEKLRAEKERPRADVYWGNEPFHTINLAADGVLAPYASPAAADIPARWRGPDDLYTGTGLRARVIAVSTRAQNKELVAKIRAIEDLTDPVLKGKIGVCHPAFGTASGQFAALYVAWGPRKYETVLRGLRANEIKLLGGNAAVTDQVSAGTLVAGPTDNDDVCNAQADDQPIDLVVPNQQDVGTLLIPTTVALVKGAPNPDAARALIDFLLRPEVEDQLIQGRYLAYSVRTAAERVKAMDVDYAQVAGKMRQAVELALTILQDRKP